MNQVLVLDCRHCGGGIHIDLSAPEVPVVSRPAFLDAHRSCLTEERSALARVA